MNSENLPSLTDAYFRRVNEGDPSCIACLNCDLNQMNVNDYGIIKYKCILFDIDVDELHICDLIR